MEEWGRERFFGTINNGPCLSWMAFRAAFVYCDILGSLKPGAAGEGWEEGRSWKRELGKTTEGWGGAGGGRLESWDGEVGKNISFQGTDWHGEPRVLTSYEYEREETLRGSMGTCQHALPADLSLLLQAHTLFHTVSHTHTLTHSHTPQTSVERLPECFGSLF